MARRLRGVVLVTAVAALLGTGACGGSKDAGLRVTSTAFGSGAKIPERFSCLGLDVSPPLQWSNVPMSAQQLVVVVSDPDAPSGTFYHWLLYGVDAGRRSLAEGEVPSGARQGKASSEAVGYVGMCPPEGETHTYHFTIYALDRKTRLQDGATAKEVLAEVHAHELARGELTGTFHQ
jgi:Raf kinase inhibitor-like YbhB/YbcL family protein